MPENTHSRADTQTSAHCKERTLFFFASVNNSFDLDTPSTSPSKTNRSLAAAGRDGVTKKRSLPPQDTWKMFEAPLTRWPIPRFGYCASRSQINDLTFKGKPPSLPMALRLSIGLPCPNVCFFFGRQHLSAHIARYDRNDKCFPAW